MKYQFVCLFVLLHWCLMLMFVSLVNSLILCFCAENLVDTQQIIHQLNNCKPL